MISLQGMAETGVVDVEFHPKLHFLTHQPNEPSGNNSYKAIPLFNSNLLFNNKSLPGSSYIIVENYFVKDIVKILNLFIILSCTHFFSVYIVGSRGASQLGGIF